MQRTTRTPTSDDTVRSVRNPSTSRKTQMRTLLKMTKMMTMMRTLIINVSYAKKKLTFHLLLYMGWWKGWLRCSCELIISPFLDQPQRNGSRKTMAGRGSTKRRNVQESNVEDESFRMFAEALVAANVTGTPMNPRKIRRHQALMMVTCLFFFFFFCKYIEKIHKRQMVIKVVFIFD